VLDVLKLEQADLPTLRNASDAVVLALHANMLELGFRLTHVHEQPFNAAPLPTHSHSPAAPTPSIPPSSVFPGGWDVDPSAYSFKYTHPQSSMTFLIKAIPMGDLLLVHGRALEDKKVFSVEVTPSEFVGPESLRNFSSFDGLFQNLDTLLSLFRIDITSKLLPMINKPGYEDGQESTTTSTATSRQPPSSAPPRDDPLRIPPRQPYRDPFAQPPLMVGGPYGGGPAGYFGVGEADRFPALGGPFGGDGGNLIGPNHPGFGPARPFGSRPPGFGYDPDRSFGLPPSERLPPGAVPPGARFDPFGPPPRGMPPRGGPPSGYGDELPPPGYENMYL